MMHESIVHFRPATTAFPNRLSRSLPTRWGGMLKGCLIAAVIVVVLGAIAGVYVARNWKNWAADGAKFVAVAAVDQSKIPADQKTRINARLNTLADDFKAGKIDTEKLAQVMKMIGESPVLPLAIVLETEAKYFVASKLSDEERVAGRRTLQRVARGVVEKKIPQPEIESLMSMISVAKPGGPPDLRPTLTDDELKAFLEAAKSKADAATIPDEEYTINFADEVEKAIDAALK